MFFSSRRFLLYDKYIMFTIICQYFFVKFSFLFLRVVEGLTPAQFGSPDIPLQYCIRKLFTINHENSIDKYGYLCYNYLRNQEITNIPAGGKEMQDGMTNDQLNAMLEAIAKLVEAKARTVEEAAKIIRDSKTK